MNSIQFLCSIITGLIASLGLVIWCFAIWPPRWMEIAIALDYPWPKILAELLQLVSACVGIFASFADPTSRPGWFLPAIFALFSTLVWKVCQVQLDYLQKRESKRAANTANAFTRLLTGIASAVRGKLERVSNNARSKGGKPTRLADIREVFTPRSPELNGLLDALAIILKGDESAPFNVRVGLYVTDRDGYMIPKAGVSLSNPGYNPFDSASRHRDAFRFKEPVGNTLVVKCMRSKRTLIIEDCITSASEGEFHFTHPEQREYLRSTIAYYLGSFGHGAGSDDTAVIAIDANRAMLSGDIAVKFSSHWSTGELR